MIHTAHVLTGIALLLALSICGYSLALFFKGLVQPCQSDNQATRQDHPHPHPAVFGIPQGISTYLIIGIFTFTLGIQFNITLRQLAGLHIAFLALGMLSSVHHYSRLRHHPAIGSFWHGLRAAKGPLLLIAIIGLSAFTFGRYPIFLSDDFGHITIINRMLTSGNLTTPTMYMPNEPHFIFFPWHALLAGMGSLLRIDAIEMYAAAKIFISISATLSFLSFCRVVFKDLDKAGTYIFCTVITFILLSPEIFIFRGAGDYRGVVQTLVFQASILVWESFTPGARHTPRLIALVLICFAIILVHPIDMPAFMLMFFPFGAVIAVQNREKRILADQFILFIVIALFSFLVYQSYYAQMKTTLQDVANYKRYAGYYLSRFDYEIGIPVTLLSIGILGFHHRRQTGHHAFSWPIIALLSSLLLGSINPLLEPIYARLVSSDLMERTMFAFPIAFAAGTSLACVVQAWRFSDRHRFVHMSLLVLLTASIGRQVWTRYGLNGVPSYAWPGYSYSLIRKQPNLYQYLSTLDNKIILSDLITSAPITAISENYTYNNRPWVELNRDRIPRALAMMQDFGSPACAFDLYRQHIDMIVYNPKAPFHPEQHADWVFSSYYPARIAASQTVDARYFTLTRRLDGASVYTLNTSAISQDMGTMQVDKGGRD